MLVDGLVALDGVDDEGHRGVELGHLFDLLDNWVVYLLSVSALDMPGLLAARKVS
jgi:hypothetical protein